MSCCFCERSTNSSGYMKAKVPDFFRKIIVTFFIFSISLIPLKDQFFLVWLEAFGFHWQLAENLYAFLHGIIYLLWQQYIHPDGRRIATTLVVNYIKRCDINFSRGSHYLC